MSQAEETKDVIRFTDGCRIPKGFGVDQEFLVEMTIRIAENGNEGIGLSLIRTYLQEAEIELPMVSYGYLLRVSRSLSGPESWMDPFLDFIMTAYRDGSDIARACLQSAAKIVFKKEYSVVKRYSLIRYQDLIDYMATDSEENKMDVCIAEHLGLAELFGIRIEESEKMTDLIRRYDIKAQKSEKMTNDERMDAYRINYDLLKKAKEFYMEHRGTFEDVLKDRETLIEIAKIFRGLLRRAKYTAEFSADQVRIDSNNVLDCIYTLMLEGYDVGRIRDEQWSALICAAGSGMQFLDGILVRDNFLTALLVDPETENLKINLPRKTEGAKKELPVRENQTDKAKDISSDAEIEDLKLKMRCMETQVQQLKEENQMLKAEAVKTGFLLEEMEEIRQEAAALREYIYTLPAEDEPEPVDSSDDRDYIRDRKLLIVGGREQWRIKLSSTFPKWKIMSPDEAKNADTGILDNMDGIYIAADVLNHAAYYKISAAARRKGLPLSYLSGTNINATVAAIAKNERSREIR